MKTISVSVSAREYERFREEARQTHRSIAQLIREAMTFYRREKLSERSPLRELPVLAGHELVGDLPDHETVYEEMFDRS